MPMRCPCDALYRTKPLVVPPNTSFDLWKPQGHLLAYYASYEETPIHCANYKERNMLDCCMITQIRPASIYNDGECWIMSECGS